MSFLLLLRKHRVFIEMQHSVSAAAGKNLAAAFALSEKLALALCAVSVLLTLLSTQMNRPICDVIRGRSVPEPGRFSSQMAFAKTRPNATSQCSRHAEAS